MKRRWMIAATAAVALAFVATGISGCRETGPATAKTAAGCDEHAKRANLDFTLKDMNGSSVNLASFRGKVIVLDFWATWCPPCKVEIPSFVDLQNRYRGKGLVVVGVSVDDTSDKLKPFATEFQMNYPVLVGLNNDEIQQAYGPIWGLPTTYVITREGMICNKHMGLTSKDEFEKVIQQLL